MFSIDCLQGTSFVKIERWPPFSRNKPYTHMTPVKRMFKSLEKVNPYPVHIGDKSTLLVEKRGNVDIFINVSWQKSHAT